MYAEIETSAISYSISSVTSPSFYYATEIFYWLWKQLINKQINYDYNLKFA